MENSSMHTGSAFFEVNFMTISQLLSLALLLVIMGLMYVQFSLIATFHRKNGGKPQFRNPAFTQKKHRVISRTEEEEAKIEEERSGSKT